MTTSTPWTTTSYFTGKPQKRGGDDEKSPMNGKESEDETHRIDRYLEVTITLDKLPHVVTKCFSKIY